MILIEGSCSCFLPVQCRGLCEVHGHLVDAELLDEHRVISYPTLGMSCPVSEMPEGEVLADEARAAERPCFVNGGVAKCRRPSFLHSAVFISAQHNTGGWRIDFGWENSVLFIPISSNSVASETASALLGETIVLCSADLTRETPRSTLCR